MPSSESSYSTGLSIPAKSGKTDKDSLRTGSPTRVSGNVTGMINLRGGDLLFIRHGRGEVQEKNRPVISQIGRCLGPNL